jgi:hypothetical protein
MPHVWRPLGVHPGRALALALAAGGELVVADDRGLRVGRVGPGAMPVLERRVRVRGVRDLAFDSQGSLWIASDEGVHRLDASSPVALRRGSGVPAASRVAGVGDVWLAATADGLRLRDPQGGWPRVASALPKGPATALALAARDGAIGVGVVIEGVAYWGRLVRGAPTAGAGGVTIVLDPRSRVEDAVDVWLSPDPGEAFTLRGDGCIVGSSRGCVPLPPGATPQRLLEAAGHFWLTTDRGSWVAARPSGPWTREGPPLRSLTVHAVAAGEAGLFAATDRGLHLAAKDRELQLTPEASALPRAYRAGAAPGGELQAGPKALEPLLTAALSDLPRALRSERREPGIDEVRRAALAYLDLGPERLRRLVRGAARRGWLPTLAVRLDRDRFARARNDHDQAFVSGATRLLLDRENERSAGFDLSLSLAWDFGDVLHHPESVDVSREVRELVELRDEVLDELRHLYFERRRVQLELLALPEGRPLEAARLRLRADELAAGIDAWTGGWFGRRTGASNP